MTASHGFRKLHVSLRLKQAKPVARKRFRTITPGYHIYMNLWKDYEDFRAVLGVDADIAACFSPHLWFDEQTEINCVRENLGEIHMVSGNWSLNTLCHEIQHALIHRMRFLAPDYIAMLDMEHARHKPTLEEAIAYQAGEWMETIFNWMNLTDENSPYKAIIAEVETEVEEAT